MSVTACPGQANQHSLWLGWGTFKAVLGPLWGWRSCRRMWYQTFRRCMCCIVGWRRECVLRPLPLLPVTAWCRHYPAHPLHEQMGKWSVSEWMNEWNHTALLTDLILTVPLPLVMQRPFLGSWFRNHSSDYNILYQGIWSDQPPDLSQSGFVLQPQSGMPLISDTSISRMVQPIKPPLPQYSMVHPRHASPAGILETPSLPQSCPAWFQQIHRTGFLLCYSCMLNPWSGLGRLVPAAWCGLVRRMTNSCAAAVSGLMNWRSRTVTADITINSLQGKY